MAATANGRINVRAIAAIAAVAIICAAAAVRAAEEPFEGRLVEARLALDTVRYDEALALFERLAADYPSRTNEMGVDYGWACVQIALRARTSGDYAAADMLFARAAQLHPPFAKSTAGPWCHAKVHLANAMVRECYGNPKAADWARPEAAYKAIITLSPGDACAHYSLGQMYEYLGRKQEAVNEYKAAIGRGAKGGVSQIAVLKASAGKASEAYRYKTGGPPNPLLARVEQGPLRKYEEKGFIVHHRNEALARRVVAALRYHLSRDVLDGVLEGVTALPLGCTVYIHKDSEELNSQSGNDATGAGFGGAMSIDEEFFFGMRVHQADPGLFEKTLPHEFAHVRCFATRGWTRGHAVWLTEGIAVSAQADFSRTSLANLLAEHRTKGDLLAPKELIYPVEYTNQYKGSLLYPESCALVNALVDKYGGGKLLELARKMDYDLRGISANLASEIMVNKQKEAFKEVYGLAVEDLDALLDEWISSNVESE